MGADDSGRAETKFDIDKVIGYFQRGATRATDAFEELLDAIESDEEVDLTHFRERLDACREHLAGYHVPMTWRTLGQAERYAEAQNAGIQATDQRNFFRVISSNGVTEVSVPRC